VSKGKLRKLAVTQKYARKLKIILVGIFNFQIWSITRCHDIL